MAEHETAGATELRLDLRGALAGNLPWITVVGIATPTISTLLILSILVATLSTVGVFLRFLARRALRRFRFVWRTWRTYLPRKVHLTIVHRSEK
jgi:hypothetical protein